MNAIAYAEAVLQVAGLSRPPVVCDHFVLNANMVCRGGLAWDDCQQVVPASPNPSTMPLYELLEGDAQLLLHSTGLVDMPADAVELCACDRSQLSSALQPVRTCVRQAVLHQKQILLDVINWRIKGLSKAVADLEP